MSKDEIKINKKDIYEVATEAVKSQIRERFSGHSSPLKEICDEVISEHREELKKIFDDALSSTLKNKKFKEAVQDEFQHKVAKNLVGKLEGSVEKAADVLRQNPTMKSRMILAVENIINENQPPEGN